MRNPESCELQPLIELGLSQCTCFCWYDRRKDLNRSLGALMVQT